MIIRQAVPTDYDSILEIQRLNTPENLDAENLQQGYIVSQMSRAQLEAINSKLGILVAVEGKTVAGFVCMTATCAKPHPPVIDALLEQAETHSLNQRPMTELSPFLYGPVCISRRFRGAGVLSQLFAAVKSHMHGKYDAGLAFIADDNPHSLVAHIQGLGMSDVTRFRFDGKDYHLVAFEV
ncbi:N-acetyltransferase [Hafnia alvei]|uniref:N-acetyltransferase n=1 Tax=Hafnia alvei TaxID=569 RepID=A0A1C6YWP2_HAFAL|nr:N-acetyltransferase [Hafnia alvei]NLS55934.1 N-acetyltransferase [Hafnia alvei]SCM51288.1 hypothetical protein BN1044_00745 [Hafnia alvei]